MRRGMAMTSASDYFAACRARMLRCLPKCDVCRYAGLLCRPASAARHSSTPRQVFLALSLEYASE